MEDFDYLNGLKALSDIFESAAEIENENVVATKNNSEPVSSESKHYGIFSSHQPEPVPEESQEENKMSDKICPSIEFTYSQDLRVQDVFLPHSIRTPSSASCEWLIVTVKMPDEVGAVKEIEADIVNRRLVVNSPKYHLDLYLPQPPAENQDSHGAKWDSDKKQLVVQVKLERELDYVNF